MSRHGRAVLPFGKYKGVSLRLIPSAYLSFLAGTEIILKEKRWDWLRSSLISELKHRGMNVEGLGEEWDEASELAKLPEVERNEVVARAFILHKRRGPWHIDEYHEGVLGRCDCIAQVISNYSKQKPLPFSTPKREITFED